MSHVNPFACQPAAPRLSVVGQASVLCVAAVGIALAGILQVEGETRISLLGTTLPESCTWRVLMGWNCPGCGLTRSFVSLAHGNLGAGWHFNPAGTVLFAALVFQLPYRTWQLVRLHRGKPSYHHWLLEIQPIVLACLLMVSWLVRLVV